MGFSNEFKVGIFVLVALAVVIIGYFATYDGFHRGPGAYELNVTVERADGLWPGSPVKLAGVTVGSVETIEVVGDRARVRMLIDAAYQLPVGTRADVKSSGLLGDAYISLVPSTSDAILQDQGWVELGTQPGDLDTITRQVEGITDDVQAITKVLREMIENDANRDHAEATLANIDALSAELRLIAEQNRSDIGAIVDSVRRLTENLESIVDASGKDVDEELDKIKDATDTLQDALTDVRSITDKIDDGQGTIGALINERDTIDALNETIENANSVIEGFSGLRARVYYVGRYYVGSQPNDPDAFFGQGNPLHLAGSNTIGVELHSQEDFWYTFEINDYPTGIVDRHRYFVPELGQTYTEYDQRAWYRFTFQFNKRWWNLAFRLGVKESGGGIGFTFYALKDRLQISGDAFDFLFGSYPAVAAGGIPNTRLGVRWEPVDGVFLEAGAEQLLLGLRYQYATGYVGVGFHFDDDDIKLLFATLPLGF